MLQRNLLYTHHPQPRLVVLVGTQKALAIAVKNMDARRRVTLLKQRLQASTSNHTRLGTRCADLRLGPHDRHPPISRTLMPGRNRACP